MTLPLPIHTMRIQQAMQGIGLQARAATPNRLLHTLRHEPGEVFAALRSSTHGAHFQHGPTSVVSRWSDGRHLASLLAPVAGVRDTAKLQQARTSLNNADPIRSDKELLSPLAQLVAQDIVDFGLRVFQVFDGEMKGPLAHWTDLAWSPIEGVRVDHLEQYVLMRRGAHMDLVVNHDVAALFETPTHTALANAARVDGAGDILAAGFIAENGSLILFDGVAPDFIAETALNDGLAELSPRLAFMFPSYQPRHEQSLVDALAS